MLMPNPYNWLEVTGNIGKVFKQNSYCIDDCKILIFRFLQVETYTRRGEYDMKFQTVLLDAGQMSELDSLQGEKFNILGVSDSGDYCAAFAATKKVSDLIEGSFPCFKFKQIIRT